MRISYSALDTFTTCPAKYKFQYIDRIKTPKSKEAVFGTLIHECLKTFHNPSQQPPITEDDLLKQFTNKWNSNLYTDKQDESFAFHQGIEILKNYYANNQGLDSKILDLETAFAIPLSEECQISGRIDRIDKLSDGGYEIIDYKTAKKMPSQEIVDDNLQLSIYHLGLAHRWPFLEKENKSVKLSLYFVRHGEKLSTTRNGDKLSEAKEQVSDLINQINQSKFEPKSTPLCNWCSFQKNCPLFRHKFINPEEEKKIDQNEIKNVVSEFFEIKSRQTIDNKKINELKVIINQYCDENKLERVFGNEGYITRLSQQRFAYDFDQLKDILEPLGKWEEVLTVNSTKLRQATKELPPQTKKEIENTKFVEKEYKVLTAKK